MRVTLLKKNPRVYSCNAYLLRGDWNTINDINTLIDCGTDGYLLDEIDTISTGVGKSRIEQIILTHEHFDHSGGVKYILEKYNPVVISFAHLPYTNILASDGLMIKVGDTMAEIFHTPGHSHDSICIYCPEEKLLFSGDTPVNIKMPGGTYTKGYVDALERISSLDIEIIFSGHDSPYTDNVNEMLDNTLRIVKRSKIL